MGSFFWDSLNCEKAENYNEFCLVLEEKLQPIISAIIVSEYQRYLKGKLGIEFNQETVKEMLHDFFEEYLLTTVI
ncbi:hypothetical protein [Geminocystis sp. NIES-3709]|uniref:hypothetical protein n=1 Tax=Geminocystis sp. NIES-3709 TaxID=1617448 RepID=UPI000824E54F|nr:hypothetical protein [Geminocystis sp. NIES-3709]